MTNSKNIAGLVGPTAIVLTLSEMLNFHIWSTNIPALNYLNGILLFLAGLAILRGHNSWKGWPVMVTLTGWFGIIGGLYRVFAPEAPQLPQNTFSYIIITFLFLAGFFLTYKAYYLIERNNSAPKKRKWFIVFLSLIALFQASLLIIHKRVPETVQFDNSLPYTEINGYKYHSEIFGNADSTAIIAVHGGPGQDYEYMKSLKELSNHYRVVFYDQRGAGLSPRVDKKYLTIEQSLDDLHSIVEHFSNGKKVKLVGHSWGAMLVVGYLSKHPETVSQAVIIEPAFLYPGASVKEWAGKFKEGIISFKDIASYAIAYPYVTKEDGDEGFDYVATKLANKNRPGPPYNCEGQNMPPNTFKRLGYKAYNNIFQPIIDNPDSFTYDFTNGISNYHGDLMLISTECSILGTAYQEKYNLPKLPAQTVHIKAAHEGHNVLTHNPEWSIQNISIFFNP